MLSKTITNQLKTVFPLKKALLKLALSLFIFLSVVGFSTNTNSALAADIEPLHGFQLTEQMATILVTSTGCTQKEDFVSVLEKTEPPTVTFIRLKPDLCKAAPRMYPIKFSLEEIGADTFTVANLIEPTPGF